MSLSKHGLGIHATAEGYSGVRGCFPILLLPPCAGIIAQSIPCRKHSTLTLCPTLCLPSPSPCTPPCVYPHPVPHPVSALTLHRYSAKQTAPSSSLWLSLARQDTLPPSLASCHPVPTTMNRRGDRRSEMVQFSIYRKGLECVLL